MHYIIFVYFFNDPVYWDNNSENENIQGKKSNFTGNCEEFQRIATQAPKIFAASTCKQWENRIFDLWANNNSLTLSRLFFSNILYTLPCFYALRSVFVTLPTIVFFDLWYCIPSIRLWILLNTPTWHIPSSLLFASLSVSVATFRIKYAGYKIQLLCQHTIKNQLQLTTT